MIGYIILEFNNNYVFFNMIYLLELVDNQVKYIKSNILMKPILFNKKS